MKIISWNVAGINAVAKKGLFEFMTREDADVYCFQEVKASPEKIPRELEFSQQGVLGGPKPLSKYLPVHSFSKKKGYSGVSTFTKIKPIKVIQGIGVKEFDEEGRVHALEFEKFFLINTYFPNANRELLRLDFKIKFNKAFEKFCSELEKTKPVLIAGDFNVAHKEIDLANPKQNDGNAGFTKEEREWFSEFLSKGHVDTFREFDKGAGNYTYWTYRQDARARNIGWRLDYFVASKKLMYQIKKSGILEKVLGSDHCPILLEIV